MTLSSTQTLRLTRECLREINLLIETLCTQEDPSLIKILTLNPDVGEGILFNGELIQSYEQPYRYYTYQTWIDLAHLHGFSFLTPLIHSTHEYLVYLRFKKRHIEGWHQHSLPSGHCEKYGIDSAFQRIKKEEEPYFLKTLQDSLNWIKLTPTSRLLSLGVNTGEELALCVDSFLNQSSTPQQWIGIDHSKSAIAAAKAMYTHPSFHWQVGDLRELDLLDLGLFDCIMCLNTLQSTLIDEHQMVRNWVQNYLKPQGALVLSFPNSRYMGTHQVYGTRVRHEKEIEYSPLFKQLVALQRYLHQHQFRVRITGKYTLFLVAKRLK